MQKVKEARKAGNFVMCNLHLLNSCYGILCMLFHFTQKYSVRHFISGCYRHNYKYSI